MYFRHAAAAAVFVLAAAPQIAQAQSGRISPVLSTTMQRACQAEVSNVTLMSGGVENVRAQPTVEANTRGLKAIRAGDGLRFEHTSASPEGSTVLTFSTAANGAVTDANLTGSSIEAWAAATPRADVPALALALADDVPERLLIGRTFAVGDQYYPEPLRRSLINRMIGNMGLPFAADGAIDIRYRGETRHEGRRAWRFSGELTAQGSGDVNGAPMEMDHVTAGEVLHDAETGLVLRYSTTATTQIDLRGQPFVRQRATDTYSCEIIPQ
ncbi:hypothetical protein [Brevundimonas viscosa]|uniref:Uncharacterized protein n=1 Tax=Brevundimonas viscosa TaxID=871741 RepID=A0A1I6QKW3_9CAUL|nr:hypothetical protein [Brevundimonas viscosa]SFS53127.1 hypothetical protein SAMN05192570_1929 [Brevundimonas viscosa]